MSSEIPNLLDEASQLKKIGSVLLDQKIAAGQKFAELKAAHQAADQVNPTASFAALGLESYLTGLSRKSLYGQSRAADNLDPQG